MAAARNIGYPIMIRSAYALGGLGSGVCKTMSTEHSKRAAMFTQNVEKTTWHDATFWSVRQKRDKMAQELPEWESDEHLSCPSGSYFARNQAASCFSA